MKTPINVTELNEMNTNKFVELHGTSNSVNGTTTASAAKSNNNNMSNQSNNNINSPKMGSRRIFTPQFKLQVLESYRNDSDCKGNQRATARKYNIHRRQIQKWLQCESNLRSSVTNLNQNNIKHQFHNISRQTQSIGSATNHSAYSHQQQQQHIQPLSLDTVRQRVNLNSLASSSSANSSGSHEMFAATHLAAVVAAAAAAGASGAISTPTTSTNPTHSPLRPTALNGVSSVNSNSTMSSSIMQQYSMVYSPAVAMTVPPVPILTHHMSQQHIHHQYQYNHNLSSHVHNIPTLSEARPTAFVPTVCLPATTSTALLNDNSREWMKTVGLRNCATEFAPATADIIEEIQSETSQHDKTTEKLRIFTTPQSYVTMVPIDLSLGIRRENLHENTSELDRVTHTTILNNMGDIDDYSSKNENNEHNKVVDLTFRKRKSFVIQSDSEELPEKQSKASDGNVSDGLTTTKNVVSHSKPRTVNPKDIDKEDEIDVEGELIVDVDGEEKSTTPPLKPVKLFKPYLLDSNNDDDGDVSKCFKLENINEQKAPIIWSNHPECLSPRSFDSRQCSSRESYFQSPSIEKCPFPFGSPPLQKNQISLSENHHNNHRNNTPTTSKVPTSLCCPKGSPVSGYESSSSSYSENSFRGDAIDHFSRSYRFDLKMQRVYNESVIEHQSHIQRWLNHGTPSSESSASIVLYA